MPLPCGAGVFLHPAAARGVKRRERHKESAWRSGHFSCRRNLSASGSIFRARRNVLRGRQNSSREGGNVKTQKALRTPSRSKEKIQGTYFEICALYFKICQTFFCPCINRGLRRPFRDKLKFYKRQFILVIFTCAKRNNLIHLARGASRFRARASRLAPMRR